MPVDVQTALAMLRQQPQTQVMPWKKPGLLPPPNQGPAFASGNMSQAPEMLNHLYGMGLQDELGDRLFNAERTVFPGQDPRNAQVGGDITALKGLLSRNAQSIAADPITRQGIEVRDYMNQEREARNAGFTGSNPIQESAMYGRGQAEQKMNMPLRQQEVQAQADRDVAVTQGQTQRDVAGINQQGLSGRANLMQSLLEGGLLPPGASASFSGVGSVRQPATMRTPTALNRDVARAQALLADNPDDAQAQAFLQSSLGAVLAQPQWTPNTRRAAQDILSDPALKDTPLSQIIDPSNPGFGALDQLLLQLRGPR